VTGLRATPWFSYQAKKEVTLAFELGHSEELNGCMLTLLSPGGSCVPIGGPAPTTAFRPQPPLRPSMAELCGLNPHPCE
jgi:hypothetical protein